MVLAKCSFSHGTIIFSLKWSAKPKGIQTGNYVNQTCIFLVWKSNHSLSSMRFVCVCFPSYLASFQVGWSDVTPGGSLFSQPLKHSEDHYSMFTCFPDLACCCGSVCSVRIACFKKGTMNQVPLSLVFHLLQIMLRVTCSQSSSPGYCSVNPVLLAHVEVVPAVIQALN